MAIRGSTTKATKTPPSLSSKTQETSSKALIYDYDEAETRAAATSDGPLGERLLQRSVNALKQ